MTKKTIYGANRCIPHKIERACARGIVVHNGKLLLSYVPESDFFMTPGGGLEVGETLPQCCVREIAEETGYIVKPMSDEPFYLLNEYYGEYKFINNFFICALTGEQTETHLTSLEKEQKLVQKWVDLDDAIDIFAHHNDHAATNEDKRGSYLRDFTALECAKETGAI